MTHGTTAKGTERIIVVCATHLVVNHTGEVCPLSVPDRSAVLDCHQHAERLQKAGQRPKAGAPISGQSQELVVGWSLGHAEMPVPRAGALESIATHHMTLPWNTIMEGFGYLETAPAAAPGNP